MLSGPGELVEQGGLAAVLVPHQGEGQGHILRQRIAAALGMVFARLPQARMMDLLFPTLVGDSLPGFGPGHDVDLSGLRQPQGQGIAVDPQLHGISQGGVLDQRDLRAGDHAHVQKMLPQGPLAPHSRYGRRLADGQFFECHRRGSLPNRMDAGLPQMVSP